MIGIGRWNISNFEIVQWEILRDFLESPVDKVFDYRIRQEEREQMESAIYSVKVDLRTETIRMGSPHTLRIIKTQFSYDEARRKWLEDVELLKQF